MYSPTSPQPSPDDAAALLVEDWSRGDRPAAGAVASPGAVATLFAIPYPVDDIQARGCTAPSVDLGTCTYRNLQTNGIYEIAVTHTAKGWYVTGVTPE